MSKPLVGIIMGSDSDLSVMKEAGILLDEFHIPYEVSIISAHRTPVEMVSYAKNAHERGLKVIIAGAGGSAHLPGMTASLTPLPVIGVPVETKTLKGLDSLLSIVQMPAGIPVATVAVNGAKNAALLAVEILGTADVKIQTSILRYKKNLKDSVVLKTNTLSTIGWKKYLSEKEKQS